MPTLKIRELLSDESKWTQGHLALRADGLDTAVEVDDAIRFCLYGAVERCYGPFGVLRSHEIYGRIIDDLRTDPVRWNDAPDRTFADVRALVERLDS